MKVLGVLDNQIQSFRHYLFYCLSKGKTRYSCLETAFKICFVVDTFVTYYVIVFLMCVLSSHLKKVLKTRHEFVF